MIFYERYIKTVYLIFFLRMVNIISCTNIFEIRVSKLTCIFKILNIFISLRVDCIIYHVAKWLRRNTSFGYHLLIDISLILWSFRSYFNLLFYLVCFYLQIVWLQLFFLIWWLYWALEICLLQFCRLIKTFSSLV